MKRWLPTILSILITSVALAVGVPEGTIYINGKPQGTANVASNLVSGATNSLSTYFSNLFTSVSTPTRFKAGIATNVAFPNNATTLMPMTNTLLAASGGCIYSNSASRWYPKVTNDVLEIIGHINIPTVANGQTYGLYLYKNGTNYVSLVNYKASNAGDSFNLTWTYIETVNTGTNDYYEVWFYSGGGAGTVTTSGAGTNNWWFGSVE